MEAFPPGDFKEVVRPNFDTLYSILWFDLGDEPLVISVPDTAGRYYMLPFMDMWTDVFALVGRRTTGTAAGQYAPVGPGWSGALPDGMERIDAPTSVGWVIGRTQTNGPADYAAVHEVQAGFVATPLSVWSDAPAVPTSEPDASVDMATAPVDQVLALSGVEFLRRTAELMRQYPPHLVDQPLLARMRRLGLVAGEPFDTDRLDAGTREAIETGAASAKSRMERLSSMHPVVDGWSQPTFTMGVYGTDYWRRAIVAKVGLGANLVEDAVYPVLFHEAAGNTPVARSTTSSTSTPTRSRRVMRSGRSRCTTATASRCPTTSTGTPSATATHSSTTRMDHSTCFFNTPTPATPVARTGYRPPPGRSA